MKDKRRNSITFTDAVKAGSIAFSTMVKPLGSTCNLDCHYCYYLDKEDIYSNKQPLMSDDLLEKFIQQYINANETPVVNFIWHGGEPLLAGIDFYTKAVTLQHKYKGNKEIQNVIQTNGILINQQWAVFFRDNNFLVGISIDGSRDIHDAFRKDKGGHPTFDRTIKAIELLAKTGVEYNTLSTVNKLSEGRGKEVYRFLKSIGSHYMQFLPVLEYTKLNDNGDRSYIVPPGTEGAELAPWSVTALGFGNFMNDVFDEWVLSDVGQYYVQLFDVTLAQWHGVQPGLCSFAETCGDSLVVEHNGDVYSCDHYVYPQFKLGNINESNLHSMFRSKEQFSFGINKRNSLPEQCLKCKWYFACKGECPKHRFVMSDNGEDNLNALCLGYRAFFAHVSPYMKFMSDQISNNLPPALVMQWARKRMGLIL